MPYLFLYLTGAAIPIPVSVVRLSFCLLHLANVILFAFHVYFLKRRIPLVEIIFWLSLFTLLVIPGAYLEYPSDPWEHFRRIYSWEGSHFIRDNAFWRRFSYFWDWSLVGKFDPLHRRLPLDLLSAFWQWLLCFQVFRFLLQIGFSRGFSLFQTVAFLILFGTNLFSFRYYALASTMPSYIAYLALLGLIVTSTVTAPLFFGLFLMILFNHTQEIIFLVLSFAAILVGRWVLKDPAKVSHRLSLLGTLFLFSFGIGWLLQYFFPHPQLTSFGNYAIWKPQSSFIETLGIHGITALFFALIFFKKFPTLAALSLAPTVALVCPLSAFLGALVSYQAGEYRILYAMPTSFALCTGLSFALKRFHLSKRVYWAVFAGVIFLFSLWPKFPWRGRLFFQFYRPHAEKVLKQLDETAQWFYERKHLWPGNCRLLADDMTGFALSAHLGKPVVIYDRLVPIRHYREYRDTLVLNDWGRANRFCGILIPILEKAHPSRLSVIALLGRHWFSEMADIRWLMDTHFIEQARGLTSYGWIKEDVPPYFEYYHLP